MLRTVKFHVYNEMCMLIKHDISMYQCLTALYFNGAVSLDNERLFLCYQLLNATCVALTAGRISQPLRRHFHEFQL